MASNEQSSAYMPGCPLLLLGNMLPSVAPRVLSDEKMYLVILITPFGPLYSIHTMLRFLPPSYSLEASLVLFALSSLSPLFTLL